LEVATLQRFRDRFIGFLLALASVALAILASMALSPVLQGHVLFLFLAATIVAALYGGFIAGGVAVVASVLAHDYFFQEPKYTLLVHSTRHAIELIFFFLVAGVVSWLGSRVHFLQRKAESETRAREVLMGAVSHDLKNPLGAISLNAQLILREKAQTPLEIKMHARAQSILSVTKRMDTLIKDLLLFEKIQSGSFVADLKNESVGQIINDVTEIMEPLALKKSLQFNVIYQAENLEVSCDRDGVYHVLSNLLGNAVKFTQKGSVTLRVKKEGGKVVFDVEDDGPGIPEKDIPLIFNKYWQSQETAKLGTGLGLFISKKIVESHGEKISVKSEAGGGCDFSFSLPVHEPTLEI
jgi:signal transduction histidine kinase